MRVHHRGLVEDDIAGVGAVLALVAGAAVLDLLVAEVQLGRGEAPDDVTAVQVAVLEEEAGLLGPVVGEIPAVGWSDFNNRRGLKWSWIQIKLYEICTNRKIFSII